MRLTNCDKCCVQRSELHLQLGSQSSTGSMYQGYQKKLYISVSDSKQQKYIHSMQCACSNRTSAG
jgi:hypothetical protein